MEDILGEPRVHVPNVLPTHPTLMMDSDVIIQTFLPYFAYPMDSSFPPSSGNEDTIFDPDISTLYFSSLKPVAYENPIVIFLFFCFCPKDKGIQGEIPQDHEDPCLFSILQSSGLRSFAYFGILNPDHIPSGESKVHIEVLSVLWGNRTPGPLVDSTYRCGQLYKGLKTKQKRHRLLTGGQPPLTGGPAVVRRWSAAVDRRWPPLTGGCYGDGTLLTPRGTTLVVTRGILMIECQIAGKYEVQTDMSIRGMRWQAKVSVRGHFSPQWKFFIHTILHCLSSKKTAWDQFSSNIATAIICLATSRRFNFSKFIFEAMVKNLDSPHKFLLYPRFIQLLLNKQQRLLLPNTRTYPTPTLTSKLFSNMRRASKGYSGVVTPLFEKPIQPTHEAEETASMPHDSPLHAVHSHGSAEGSMQQHDLTVLVNKLNDRIYGLEKDLQQTKRTYSTALTKLVLRVKKLEYKLRSGKARRKAKIVLSDDKEIEEEVHEKPSDETEVIVQEETPTEIIEEHRSGEKGKMEISTASPTKVTKVSTAEAHVYTRRKAKDKGKAIMEEPATPKKVKKRTQVQLSMDKELARKMEEEERARFNAEQKARALQEEEQERLNLEAAWEFVLKYHALKNKPVSIAQVRRNMITYLKNQGESEVEKGSSKPSKRETLKTVEEEKVEKEDVKPDPVMSEKKAVGTRRKTLARRRASDKQVEDSSKRQKKEKESDDFEQEKEDLRIYLIVNWEYWLLGRMEMKDMEVYKLTRTDGTVSFHGGVHSVFLIDTPMEINMLVEKKYPLKKEILEKMINLKLQAEEESTMAFELIKFTRSQIEEKQ
ncbi:hypothetical protein Tco_0344275 [Tanacetum coccineum]